jgi:hypothetical protein
MFTINAVKTLQVTSFIVTWTHGVKVIPVLLTEHHATEAYWGCRGITPRIINLGDTWRWGVRFTPRPLYPQWKCPGYPLDRRLGGPQSRSGEKSPALAGTRTPDHPAHSTALELSQPLDARGEILSAILCTVYMVHCCKSYRLAARLFERSTRDDHEAVAEDLTRCCKTRVTAVSGWR